MLNVRVWVLVGFALIAVAATVSLHANWRDSHRTMRTTNWFDDPHRSATDTLLAKLNAERTSERNERDAGRAVGIIGLAAFGVAAIGSVQRGPKAAA